MTYLYYSILYCCDAIDCAQVLMQNEQDVSNYKTGIQPSAGYRQPLRLSWKTACSPNRFQNHHGAVRRRRLPQALRATAFSILAPDCSQRARKSLMVQKWIFGVSYQL